MWKGQFIQLMLDSNFEEAIKMKAHEMPNRLYKYRAINEYSLSNLESDTIWITSPNNYNDPYDSSVFFDLSTIKQSLLSANLRHIFQYALVLGFHKDKTEGQNHQTHLKNAISLLLKQHYPDKAIKIDQTLKLDKLFFSSRDAILNEFNIRLKSSLKMCAFSERKDSMLLWSHYSQEHTGFCMEYDFKTTINSNKAQLFPVMYSPELFDSTRYIASDLGRLSVYYPLIASLFKAEEWSYEKEWRLVYPAGSKAKDQNITVPKPTAIYLGSRMTRENKAQVVNIAKRKDIPVYQMKLDERHFRISSSTSPIEI